MPHELFPSLFLSGWRHRHCLHSTRIKSNPSYTITTTITNSLRYRTKQSPWPSPSSPSPFSHIYSLKFHFPSSHTTSPSRPSAQTSKPAQALVMFHNISLLSPSPLQTETQNRKSATTSHTC
ncbi:hypothetical protein IQ06DRAFT_293660 [Phaeosphaeriaceae sp. SRC1lsM3a]|nr:hypothetical protein IQ06DRAFT_293660 [Stagonospora sp. SRC1lsM3a]